MYALADCNNFYVSCERAFNPSLMGKPVIVLSNNDGCAISRSNEAKALGIKMAVPYHKILSLVRQHNVAVYSSNYTLYADMSARVMSILSSFTPELEVYSIDEAFLNFEGFEYTDIKKYSEEIAETVYRSTGLPLSMGVAPTKTLAKLANRFAKRYPKYNNVCSIDTDDKRIKALQLTAIGDIWGIGRRSAVKLQAQGVATALDFTRLSRSWVRKNMTIVGERTWLELKGEPCIDMEHFPPEKQQICTSRSFAKLATSFDVISEAVAKYAELAAIRLREQRSCSSALIVFIENSPFRDDLPHYFKSNAERLPSPTNSSLELVKAAVKALRGIYQDGYKYKRAGVVLTDICDENMVQASLFDQRDKAKHAALMKEIDRLNLKYGNETITTAATGTRYSWKHKQEMLSPCYTTKLSDILKVKA